MSQQYYDGDDPAGSSSKRPADQTVEQLVRPNYMTVGQGSTSASAAALMSTLNRDSGYGGSLDDSYSNDGAQRWNAAVTEDHYTPADTPGASNQEDHHRQIASHIYTWHYNQNRNVLARQITKVIDTLKKLQRMNATWPAQYPAVREPETARPGVRPLSGKTWANASSTDLRAKPDQAPLRPHAPRRAETSLGEKSTAEASSDAETREIQEPERLITPQSAQEFSVLKLNMNLQGFSQAEIAHSMEKKTIASLLDGKINQSVRHLLRLRERIEDTSSKVLVTGDLNAGKSTFCNALLRKKILPEDQQPCTSIFCEVLDAKENGNLEEAHAVHKDTNYERNDESTYDVYQLHELEKVVTDNERYTQCKVYVKDNRNIKESLLNNGVVDISIIDAPGLNSDSLKTTAVFARQEEIDVVVFVVSAANHFTLSAKEFIWNAAHEKAYIFMVVNGFDNIRDKARCERMILEQVANLSPRTFKESKELVHFVSSNAIPTKASPGPPDGGDGGAGGGSGSSSGSSDNLPQPEDDEDEETVVKHGEPGSPPDKGKGKDKEKIQDFEELEQSLRRFVLEKRARSKLAPARTYLLNILADLHYLSIVNSDVATSELKRVLSELEEIEPAFERSSRARTEVGDELENTIEQSCAEIYKDTRTVIQNAITQSATGDLGIPYPGFTSAFQYAEDLKQAMLEHISSAVSLSEDKAKTKTISSVNTIKNLGILHLGDKFPDLSFNSDKMFSHRRAHLAREVNFDIEIADFCDLSSLWEQHDKLAGTSMALTVVGGALTTRLMGGYAWVDGVLGAIKVMGPQNARRMIVPGIILSALLTTTYILSSLPRTLPRRLSKRISTQLEATDYPHRNANRIAHEVRHVLRYPAENLRSALTENVKELKEKREDKIRVKGESDVAIKFFDRMKIETRVEREVVDGVDLEGAPPEKMGG